MYSFVLRNNNILLKKKNNSYLIMLSKKKKTNKINKNLESSQFIITKLSNNFFLRKREDPKPPT